MQYLLMKMYGGKRTSGNCLERSLPGKGKELDILF